MKNTHFSILAIVTFAAAALNGQTMGSVAGTVVENGSLPLAGATVTYSAMGHSERDALGRFHYIRPTIDGSVQAHADGTFAIIGLTAGQYVICAHGSLSNHISSCAWNISDSRVSITAGQNRTGLRLNVVRGTLLDIAIVDSAGCVGKNSKAPVFVFANSLPQQAVFVSNTGNVYHYQGLVPQQVPVRVRTNHPCSLVDTGGNALPLSGVSISPFQGESASVTITAK